MAKLTALTIAVALIIDLLFLPPLLMTLDRLRAKAPEPATEATVDVTAQA